MRRHLERVEWDDRWSKPPPPPPGSGWPWDIPAVRQVIDHGFDMPAGLTILVGDNGSGKSTLVEAIAEAYPRRGAVHDRYFSPLAGTEPSGEDSPLGSKLRCRTDPQASPGGFFLRAELMHAFLAAVDRDGATPSPISQRSHGESFLDYLTWAADTMGFYLLDEPESALSFNSCLGLIGLLGDLVAAGSQVLLATHSPLLAATRGATLFEVGADGLTPTSYDELALVRDWRSFLEDPQRWLRHL